MDLVKRFKILISTPSDVSVERQHVESAIAEFNRTTGEVQGIMLSGKHWSLDTYPEVGDRPQELLNKQLVRDCDAVIAIFASRFGSPTGKYDSGTEEEIEEMIKAGKPVFLYFSELTKDPSTIDLEQFERVKKFKTKYQSHSLFSVFKAESEIEKKVHRDLTLFFLKEESTANESAKTPASSLKIGPLSQDESKLSTYFISVDLPFFANMTGRIKNHIKKISTIKIENPYQRSQTTTSSVQLGFINNFVGEEIYIDDDMRSKILNFSKHFLGQDLPDSFFSLGEIRVNKFPPVSFPGAKSYTGDQKSQEKFREICELEREIDQFKEASSWISQFKAVNFFQPSLSNIGGHFDEDISIDLFFPANAVEDPRSLMPPEFEAFPIVTSIFLPFLFEPRKNVDVEEYSDYPLSTPSLRGTMPVQFKNQTEVFRERMRDYTNWLEEHFAYEIHRETERDVISCKFKYLRQHTSMFFPAPILLRRIGYEIQYRIRSKHSSSVVTGSLLI